MDLKFPSYFSTIIVALLLSNIAVAQENWELAKDKDGVKVFTKTSDDSNFKDAKAKVEINASLKEVLGMLMDVKTHKSWMDRIELSDMLEQNSDTDFVAYYQVETPWPVTNRDVVSHYTLKRVARNKVKLVVNGKPDHIPEKDGFVRIRNSESIWEIYENENGKVSILLISKSDPGGNIPAWLANSAASENPYKTLLGLKQKLED